MRFIYTPLVLLCAAQSYAMECKKAEIPPLKKQKTISEHKVSVPEMIAKIYIAINQKNASEAALWHARLCEKIYVDWKFLNEEQIASYVTMDCDMFQNIHTILPQEIKELPPSDQEARYKPEALAWIRQAVEINTDITLDWRAIFDNSKPDKSIPSPQSLRKHRLEQLDKIGALQTQSLTL